MSALRRLWSEPHVRWLSAIVFVALALRLASVIVAQPDPTDPIRFDDTVLYDFSAQALADGRGYLQLRPHTDGDSDGLLSGVALVDCPGPFRPPLSCVEVPAARWPPGYPLVLAGIYFVFGHTLILARLLNVILGTATVVLVYALGCKLGDRRVGLLGAFLFALYPSHVLFSSLLMTEVSFTFLFVGVLLLAVTWGEEGLPTWWRLAVLGVLTGLAAMVRGEAILLPLAIAFGWALIWHSPRQAVLSAAVMMAGLTLVFIPWTVRNIVQMNAPILATTGGGGALIQAHFPQANGGPDIFVELRYESLDEYKDVPYPEREVKLYNRYIKDSLTFMLENPRREMQLVFLRFQRMFWKDNSGVVWLQLPPPSLNESVARVLSVFSHVHYFTVAFVAVASVPLWFSLRHSTKVLLVVVMAYYIGLHVLLFVGEARYHVPLMPILVLWAAMGLLFAWDRRPRPAD